MEDEQARSDAVGQPGAELEPVDAAAIPFAQPRAHRLLPVRRPDREAHGGDLGPDPVYVVDPAWIDRELEAVARQVAHVRDQAVVGPRRMPSHGTGRAQEPHVYAA
jgi:hypothetical protein